MSLLYLFYLFVMVGKGFRSDCVLFLSIPLRMLSRFLDILFWWSSIFFFFLPVGWLCIFKSVKESNLNVFWFCSFVYLFFLIILLFVLLFFE